LAFHAFPTLVETKHNSCALPFLYFSLSYRQLGLGILALVLKQSGEIVVIRRNAGMLLASYRLKEKRRSGLLQKPAARMRAIG
jgi:hypothetical protein